MRLSLNWLNDFIKLDIEPNKLREFLTMGGLEVESTEELNGDVVFALGVPPNRADCLSVLGLVREVSALTGKKPLPLKDTNIKGSGKIKDFLNVIVKAKEACPRYTARVVRNVKTSSSPKWMVDRLAACGIRSINNVVDATNYVMMEMGQPLHAFDYDLLNGKKIIVSSSDKSFEFTTLDNEKRKVEKGDLLICDGEGAVALAGIIGGGNSEVSDSTTTLVLESAYFEPRGIRRTSKRLGVITESSRRFERGLDPEQTAAVLNCLTVLITELAGGEPTEDWVDIKSGIIKPRTLRIDQSEIKRILGVEIPIKDARLILDRLGFKIKSESKNSLNIITPLFRPDVERPADVIEELARINGYDKIEETIPVRLSLPVIRPRFSSAESLARDALMGCGLTEAVMMEFDSPENLAPFSDLGFKSVSITNPLSQEQALMRTMLLPGLLTAVKHNMYHQRRDIRLYSLQRVYYKVDTDKAWFGERLHVAGAISGRRGISLWDGTIADSDFYEIKGAVESLIRAIGLHKDSSFVAKDDLSFLCPGKSANLVINGRNVGFVGGLHPDLVRKMDFSNEVFVFELDFEALAEFSLSKRKRFSELSRYPFVERDLAILVDANISDDKILQLIKGADIPFLEDVKVFDMYKGKGIPVGKKSLAYSIKYSSYERTLTDDEINEAHLKVVKSLERELGAKLRT